MPEITESTPTDTITIAGEAFKVPQPYSEGHVLTANEAASLNQTYAENLRNNFASKVKAAKEAGSFDAQMLQAQLDDYANEYEFGVRRSGGGGRTTDPVEAEAMTIARQKLREAIRKQGKNLKDYTQASITEGAKNLIAKYPEITAAAQKIVDDRKFAEQNGGGMEVDLQDLEPAPTETASEEAPAATSKRKAKATDEGSPAA